MLGNKNVDDKIDKLKSLKEMHNINKTAQEKADKNKNKNNKPKTFGEKMMGILNIKRIVVNIIFVWIIHLVLIMSVTHKKERNKNKVKLLENYIYEKLRKPANSFLPSVLAFSMFITLIPIATFLGIVFLELTAEGKNSNFIATIQNFINEIFGQSIGSQIFKDLTNTKNTQNWIAVGSLAIISLYISISSARKIIMVAGVVYNEEYKIPLRNTYLKSSILIFLLNFFLILALMLSSFLSTIVGQTNVIWLWDVLKIPFTIFIIYILLVVVFVATPQERVSWRSVHPGSLVASFLLYILIAILTTFNKLIFKYTSYYGAVASMMSVAIVFLFLSTILYYGFVINSAIYKVYSNPIILKISEKKFNKILKSKNKRNLLRFQSRKDVVQVKTNDHKHTKPNYFSKIPDKEIEPSRTSKLINKLKALKNFKNRNKKNK